MTRNGILKLTFMGHRLSLTAERFIYAHDERLLALGDVHLGKDRFFQRSGVPLPDALHHDLERISAACRRFRPAKLVFLGDLIHHHDGVTDELVDTVALARRAWPSDVLLITGNHDRYLPSLPASWHIEQSERLSLGSLSFTHHPESSKAGERGLNLHGHLHPVVTLRSRNGRECVRLPCFVAKRGSLTLPAFGALTGGHPVQPDPEQRLYAVAGSELLEITGQLAAAARYGEPDRFF